MIIIDIIGRGNLSEGDDKYLSLPSRAFWINPTTYTLRNVCNKITGFQSLETTLKHEEAVLPTEISSVWLCTLGWNPLTFSSCWGLHEDHVELQKICTLLDRCFPEDAQFLRRVWPSSLWCWLKGRSTISLTSDKRTLESYSSDLLTSEMPNSSAFVLTVLQFWASRDSEVSPVKAHNSKTLYTPWLRALVQTHLLCWVQTVGYLLYVPDNVSSVEDVCLARRLIHSTMYQIAKESMICWHDITYMIFCCSIWSIILQSILPKDFFKPKQRTSSFSCPCLSSCARFSQTY